MATDTRKKRNTYYVDETLETPFSLSHLKRSLVYVKRHKKSMLLALMFSSIAIICWQIMPYLFMTMIDKFIANKNIKGMLIIGFIQFILVVLATTCERQRSLISARTGQIIVSEIRSDLFSHLQKLPFDYFDSRPHGKILVRVVNYVNTVADFFANGLINVILEFLSLIFIIFFMFMTNVALTWIVLSGLFPFALYMLIIKNKQRKAARNFSNKTSNINAYYQETIEGMRVTQSFGREQKNIEIAQNMANDCRKAHMHFVKITHLMLPSVLIISTVVTIILYIAGANIEGITVGAILAMAAYCSRFWQPIQNLGNLYNNIVNTVAYLERIFETMDEKCDISDIDGAYDLPEVTGEVRFEHVVFEYENNSPILDDLNMKVRAGQSVALVGPTGAGKTTIVNLLARFYDIKSGKITIDGHDIHNVTLSSLRRQMGMMLQDTFIFSGTIMDNIRYGKLDATEEEIINAAKVVSAHDFIMSLPDGYNTVINERGSSLSAGQRQLISFARTLISDPKVLILDEATSAVDTKTELLVQKGLLSLLKGRTSFIIAHRLSTIKNCDRIMYIDQKTIAEAGNHEQLIAARGLYYELYTSQLIKEVNYSELNKE